MKVMYGNAQVPWTTLWKDEEDSLSKIKPCKYANGMSAITTVEKIGAGKPVFGKTHDVRQRKAVALKLCDICGRSLAARTKVSLSEARPTNVQGKTRLLVVEPLSCRECAAYSLKFCPHLKKKVADGTIKIRQVFKILVVAQVLTGEATMEFAKEFKPGAIGHLKMELLEYRERDSAWLEKL